MAAGGGLFLVKRQFKCAGFQKPTANVSCDSLGLSARARVQVPCVQSTRRFAFFKPTKLGCLKCSVHTPPLSDGLILLVKDRGHFDLTCQEKGYISSLALFATSSQSWAGLKGVQQIKI